MNETAVMRAYVLRRYRADGAALESVQRPTPGPGQVLVKVHATGVNPVDFKIRDGAMRLLRLHRLPLVMGSELAGVIADVNPSVQRYAVGTRVCLRTPIDTMGAFADYIAVDEARLSQVPDAVDAPSAAALPLAGLTAWQAIHEVAQVQAGERVFIAAGAGGVGSMAIQIAKLADAHVATTASPAGADLVRSLGADEVINYQECNPRKVLTGFDVALDLLGGEHTAAAMHILKPGGRLVSLSGSPESSTEFNSRKASFIVRGLLAANAMRTLRRARQQRVSYRYLFMKPDPRQLDHLLTLTAAGQLTVPVTSTAPADRLDDLLGELQQGHVKGKLVAIWSP